MDLERATVTAMPTPCCAWTVLLPCPSFQKLKVAVCHNRQTATRVHVYLRTYWSRAGVLMIKKNSSLSQVSACWDCCSGEAAGNGEEAAGGGDPAAGGSGEPGAESQGRPPLQVAGLRAGQFSGCGQAMLAACSCRNHFAQSRHRFIRNHFAKSGHHFTGNHHGKSGHIISQGIT